MSDEMKALANFMPDVAKFLPPTADAWKQPSANRKPMHEPDLEYHTDPEWLEMQDPVRCHECRDMGRVRVRLALGDPEFGKTIPCPSCFGTRNGKAGKLIILEEEFFQRSRIPVAYRRCRLTNYEPDDAPQVALCRGYLAEWPPKKPFLALVGGKGLGKTHLATAVQRYLWERHGKLSVFWSVRELLAHVKAQFDEDTATTSEAEIQRTLDYAPLLVLDDYGKEQDTPWARSFLFSLIDRRYANGWPTVITTNLSVGDDATVDRILDVDRTVLVPFSGSSYRQRTA